MLYQDGVNRQAAIDANIARPKLLICKEFQEYIKVANLGVFWASLRKLWTNAPPDAEEVCRRIVRAQRNKRSASTSLVKAKKSRHADKARIAELEAVRADRERTLAAMLSVVATQKTAIDASRPSRTSACTGEAAVQLLSTVSIQDPVRPLANTLYQCSGWREVGGQFLPLLRTQTSWQTRATALFLLTAQTKRRSYPAYSSTVATITAAATSNTGDTFSLKL